MFFHAMPEGHDRAKCPLCTLQSAWVWQKLEATPGFNEALRKGEKDIAEGRGTPFREIRRTE